MAGVPDVAAGPDWLVGAVRGSRWWVLAGCVGAVCVWRAVRWWWLRRARIMLSDRTVVALVPAAGFDPSPEEIDRHAARLARVPAVVGWAPRRGMAVRLRLSSTQSQLSYRLEGPSQASALLQLQDFADVDVVDPYASHDVPRIRFDGAPPLLRESTAERTGA
ncbi:hypothetical protein [Streptomyces drozdowiczii]|uniref:Uncharacterized protein n=1 Tax=Streptomyces drozdowiczii TaxID=202862 RepID=A0ABY6Q1Z5_9ACTN|nr:hypothetical protein [Streptomyces drozdowiczii]MCX0248000.1 hypothetical protein [Streptomyces drozdowiczii]UZK58262.1 hypothetical protein NEH16_33030 [Streptomyces drozdowiczii]